MPPLPTRFASNPFFYLKPTPNPFYLAGLYSTGQSCLQCPLFMEPSLDQSTCRCKIGINTAQGSPWPVCGCPKGMQFDMQTGCTPCPPNTVSYTSIDSLTASSSIQCTPCPEGQISDQNTCIQCPIGKYRTSLDTTCQACQDGLYAPSTSSSTCNPCQKSCGSLQANPCPTDQALYTCLDCPPPRPNSTPNGKDNCATSCDPSFYELQNTCVPCTQHTAITCPAGYIHLPCLPYTDSACIPCTNSTMPLYNSQWSYTPLTQNGPNAACTWQCMDGYKQIPLPIPVPIYQCIENNAWTGWD